MALTVTVSFDPKKKLPVKSYFSPLMLQNLMVVPNIKTYQRRPPSYLMQIDKEERGQKALR